MPSMLADAPGTSEATQAHAPTSAADRISSRVIPGVGAALLTVFLLSGASGLIYQVVWSRSLTLVFGSTTHGVATVLAAFMGGLALGSFVASRLGDRLASPLKTYGRLEIGIAILGLGVLLLTPALDAAYRALYPLAHLSLASLTLLRFLLASAFLLPATTLMGATLPILSAYFERRGTVEGEGASALYAVNTIGAVAGTAAAGFWLIPALGMLGSTIAAASANLIAAAAAIHLARRVDREGRSLSVPFSERARGRIEGNAAPSDTLSVSARAAVAAALAASGAAALILEVSWTRTLSLILGSSTQAFTLMLTTFLVGLAAGSAFAGRRLASIGNPLGAFALAELGVGLTVYLGVFLFPELPYSFVVLFRSVSPFSWWFSAGRFALAASVMLVPTLLLGATFPLAVRCWRLGTREAARPVGHLYSINTLGAIAGSLVAGFLLIPWIGLRQTLVAGAVINLSVGAFLLAASPSGRRTWRYALAGTILLMLPGLFAGAPEWNPLVMTSGVFQYAPHYKDVYHSREEFLRFHDEHKQLYYKDGPTTTVTVEKRPMLGDGRVWLVLTVNGKVDASSVGDMETQVLSSQLPLLTAADPRRVMVLGWGSGVTVGSALTHPEVDTVSAVEIEPAVVEASRFFQDFNNNPWDDPRLRTEINDGRHFLLVGDETYDVIVSEPSNPWLAGPSRLFTREFFQIAKRKLAPGGVLCQWIQLYALDTESYRSLLRTLSDVFSDVVVFKGAATDTLVMASASPIRFDVARIAARMRIPSVAADLGRVGIRDAAALLSRFRLGGDALRAFAGEGTLNTDDNALVEFRAIHNLYRATDIENDKLLTDAPSSPLDFVDLAGLPPEEAARFPIALARDLLDHGQEARARESLSRVGAGGPVGDRIAAEAAAASGDLLARSGKILEARSAWDQALKLDGSCLPALVGLGRHLLDKERDAAAAVSILARAVASHPESMEARLELGRAQIAEGRAEAAVEILAGAAATEPPPELAAPIHMQWGRACFAAGRFDCAVRELTRSLREWREVPRAAETTREAALDLGKAYLAIGETNLALEQFRTASDLGASLTGWHKTRAEEAKNRGDLAGAETHLRQAVEWNTRDPDAYHRLGDLLMRQRRWDDAAAVWKELLARRPDDPIALGGASEALRQQGRFHEAAPFLRRLIDVEEDADRIASLRVALQKASAAP